MAKIVATAATQGSGPTTVTIISSSELNAINLLHNDKWLTYEVVREILESNPRTFYGLD